MHTQNHFLWQGERREARKRRQKLIANTYGNPQPKAKKPVGRAPAAGSLVQPSSKRTQPRCTGRLKVPCTLSDSTLEFPIIKLAKLCQNSLRYLNKANLLMALN